MEENLKAKHIISKCYPINNCEPCSQLWSYRIEGQLTAMGEGRRGGRGEKGGEEMVKEEGEDEAQRRARSNDATLCKAK